MMSVVILRPSETATSVPGSFLYFEKVEKGPWERVWLNSADAIKE